MANSHDTTMPTLLGYVRTLEQMHHDWYHAVRSNLNYAEYIEWMLERTTCIQKEILKWLAAGHPPDIALRWSLRHVGEEVAAFTQDVRDVERDVLSRANRGESPRPNLPPGPEVEALVSRMLHLAEAIWLGMQEWAELQNDREAVLLDVLNDHAYSIQSMLLMEMHDAPADLRRVLSATIANLNAIARSLESDHHGMLQWAKGVTM